MVHIGDDALACLAGNRRHQGHAARRHVLNLAGILAAIGQHVAAEQIDPHALEAAALVRLRQHVEDLLQHRHDAAAFSRMTKVPQRDYGRIVKGPLAREPVWEFDGRLRCGAKAA